MGNTKNTNAIQELVINKHILEKMIESSLSHSTDDNYLPRAKVQQGQENLSLAERKPATLVRSLSDLFWASPNLMCIALGEEVKCQHKLCIWDKKNALFLPAVRGKGSWVRTELHDSAAAMSLLTWAALFPCCLTAKVQERRDVKDLRMH